MNIELIKKYGESFEKLKRLGAFNILPHYELTDFYYEVYWSSFFQLNYSSIISELNDFDISVLQKIKEMFTMYLSPDGTNNVYSPCCTLSDGKRSFALEDLDCEFLQVLFNQAENIYSQPIILSRLYDIIWVRKGIDRKNIFESGKKALQYYKIFCEELLAAKNYYVASIILPRIKSLVFGLGREFEEREEYCEYILKFLDCHVSENNLLFFSKVWEMIFEIRWGKDENEILTKLYQVIEQYVSCNNLRWQEKLTDLLVKIYGRLHLETQQQDILRSMAERYIRETDTTQCMVKIHFLSKAIDTYRRIKKNPYKNEIQKLLKEIQTLQALQGNQLQKFEYSIDISEEVNKVLDTYKDQDFQNCIGGLWTAKSFFPDREQMDEILKKSPKSMLADLVTTLYQNHLNQTVKVGGNDFSDYQNKKSYREILLNIYILPLLNLINEKFFFTEQSFQDLFYFNPFVPAGYEKLFTKGVYYFIKKMFIEAACILVPLFENSLRYLLAGIEENSTICKKDNIDVFQNKIEMSELIQRVKKESILNEAMLYHLDELINDPRSNVRNYIAHGLYPEKCFYSSDVILTTYMIFVLAVDKVFFIKENSTPHSK